MSSSGRHGGNSDKLCDSFVQGAADAMHNIEKVNLHGKNISFCSGCAACRKGACIYKDDAVEIIDKMLIADVIVLATPVYFYSMSGQMKTLLDRTYGRYSSMKEKDFYFLVTCAAPSKDYAASAADGLRHFVHHVTGANEKGMVCGVGVWEKGAIDGNPALDEAYQAGKMI